MKTYVTRLLIAIMLGLGAGLPSIQAQIPDQKPPKDVKFPRPGRKIGIPDLICQMNVIGGPVRVNGAAELPVMVVIKNQGLIAVDKFKVSVDYKRNGFNQVFIADFRVPGQQNETYPFVESLREGQSVTLKGMLRFDPAVANERVLIQALADSCVNEVGMPEWCRAHESSERNNRSAQRLVRLP